MLNAAKSKIEGAVNDNAEEELNDDGVCLEEGEEEAGDEADDPEQED